MLRKPKRSRRVTEFWCRRAQGEVVRMRRKSPSVRALKSLAVGSVSDFRFGVGRSNRSFGQTDARRGRRLQRLLEGRTEIRRSRGFRNDPTASAQQCEFINQPTTSERTLNAVSALSRPAAESTHNAKVSIREQTPGVEAFRMVLLPAG
jgi:hypothetical protein